MKKVLGVLSTFVLIGILISLFSKGISSSDFVIKITGDKGTKFSGSYMVVALGKSKSESFEGTVPMEILVTGNIVSVTAQKKDNRAKLLKVNISKDNVVQSKGETWADYGVVAVSTN